MRPHINLNQMGPKKGRGSDMAILALDLGEKRVGVAISRSGIIAEPLLTLNFGQNFFKELKKVCRREEIEKIMVGLPKSLGGQRNKQEEKIRKIAEKIGKKVKLEVELIDESYTSKIAGGRGAEDIDQEAAVIILQDYLDRKAKIKKSK